MSPIEALFALLFGVVALMAFVLLVIGSQPRHRRGYQGGDGGGYVGSDVTYFNSSTHSDHGCSGGGHDGGSSSDSCSADGGGGSDGGGGGDF